MPVLKSKSLLGTENLTFEAKHEVTKFMKTKSLQRKASGIVTQSILVVALFFAITTVAVCQQLQLTVLTDSSTPIKIDAPWVITLKLKNVGSSPVPIPQIDELVQATYLKVHVVHESGVPIFFVSTDVGKPSVMARAKNTQYLAAGQEISFTHTLNESGIGPLGYTNPQDHSTGKAFTGRFSVSASFVVNPNTLPTGGDADVFTGTVDTTAPAPILVGLTVAIDVKPGSFPNSINLKNEGRIPVAVLSTPTFDASSIDPKSIRFGAGGDEAQPMSSTLSDVNGDGRRDFVAQFSTKATGLACTSASATLKGKTRDGTDISGSDSVRIICK